MIPKKPFMVETGETTFQCLWHSGCLGTKVDRLRCCSGSFKAVGVCASSLDLCSVNICCEQWALTWFCICDDLFTAVFCTEVSLEVGRRGENDVNVSNEFCGRSLAVLYWCWIVGG